MLKKLLFIIMSCTLIFPIMGREEINFNRDFKFSLGDIPDAKKVDFDDRQWSTVHIPHSFATPYWGQSRFHVGYGWYRKTINVPKDWAGKRVSLEFEGVFQDCSVYLNGEFVGRHQGGYTGFEMNLTPFIKPGKNALSIQVNNLWKPDLAPRAGEHVFSGGIYRDIKLVVSDPVHVTYYGTFVTTPKVSKEEASVKVQTELANDTNEEAVGILQTQLFDPKGQPVSLKQTAYTLKGGETKELTQEFPPIAQPKLWHPDTPQLYKAVSSVYRDGELRDTYTTTFGIRWFEFTKDKGFFLNGEPYYIKGANVHQDRAGWGDAATNSAFQRDVKMIKDAGLNFIRGSHYPHDPAFSKACDEQGVLLWSEGLFWGIGGFKKDGYWDASAYPPNPEHHKSFEESLKQSLKEMIRTHRNHPSIIVWSMGNEAFFTDKSVMKEAKECVQRLVDYAHELDPSRPAGMGGVQREGFDKIGDIAGYNGDGCLEMNPTLPSVVAEYGSVVDNRPGAYDGYRGLVQKERFPWRSGEVLWCGFHHGSIAGSMGRMGFIDYARLPLRAWYWYRNELKGTPPPPWPKDEDAEKVTITATQTQIKADGTDDAQIIVALTNAKGERVNKTAPVTLTIEGPGIFPTGKSITFEPNKDHGPQIIEGWAATEIRAYNAGKTKITAETQGLKKASIDLQFVGAPPYKKGKTLEWIPQAAPETAPESASIIVECSKDRPTKTSDPQATATARFMNDGNPETVCTLTLDDKGDAWWQVDLENFYTVQDVNLIGCDNNDFIVEITADEGKTWVPLGSAKSERTKKDGQNYTLPCDTSNSYGRFLRIKYKGEPKGKVTQKDLSVKGNLSR